MCTFHQRLFDQGCTNIITLLYIKNLFIKGEEATKAHGPSALEADKNSTAKLTVHFVPQMCFLTSGWRDGVRYEYE